jgi:hypothetical protein
MGLARCPDLAVAAIVRHGDASPGPAPTSILLQSGIELIRVKSYRFHQIQSSFPCHQGVIDAVFALRSSE